MELQTRYDQAAPVPTGERHADDPTDRPAQRTDKPLELILGKTSVVVTSAGDAQVILDMMDSVHETSMNIANNLVDPPEVRREKERRAKELKKKELDQKRRLEESVQKELDDRRILEEIAEKTTLKA